MARPKKGEETEAVTVRAIRIPDGLWERFQEQGKVEDRPASYLVRKAMEAYLEKKKKEK
jgi:predicted DNA-binding protein